MLYGNIKHKKNYESLPEKLQACFKYFEENDLAARETGSYPIQGEDFFVNIVSYETTTRENRFWEAHKKYFDVHILLSGEERIDMAFIENMQLKEFVDKDDFLPMDGEAQASVDLLHKGDFLICWAEDAHRTAVEVNGVNRIKKAIFKVRIEDK